MIKKSVFIEGSNLQDSHAAIENTNVPLSKKPGFLKANSDGTVANDTRWVTVTVSP